MPEGRLRLQTILLAMLLTVSALLPPELSPAGLALSVAFAAGLGILLLADGRRANLSFPQGQAALAVVSCYLLLSVFTSTQPHRSLCCLLGAAFALVAFLAT